MSLLSKLLNFGKKSSAEARPLRQNTDTQTEDDRAGTRARMEAELQASRDRRDGGAASSEK